jgi:hypothetical protein
LLTISLNTTADRRNSPRAPAVLVAIGHTKATSDQIKSAVDRGADEHAPGQRRTPTIRRHPNYIWTSLPKIVGQPDRRWAHCHRRRQADDPPRRRPGSCS